MAKYVVSDTSLESIADAIREKTGKNDTLEFPNEFVDEINTIGEWQRPSEWMPYANGWNDTNFEGIYFVYDLIDNDENYPDWWAILVKTNSGQFKYDIGYVESTGNFVVSESYQENSNEVIGDFLPTQQEFNSRYFVVRILPLETNHLIQISFQPCRASKIREKYGNMSNYSSNTGFGYSILYQPCVEIYGQLSYVTNMSNAFKCFQLIHVNLLNLISLTSIEKMFHNCFLLEKIDGLETWDIQNVTNMVDTFRSCHSLKLFNGIENWDVSSCLKFDYTFAYCYDLLELDLSKWEINSESQTITRFVSEDKALEKIKLPKGFHGGLDAGALLTGLSNCEKIDFNTGLFCPKSFWTLCQNMEQIKEIDITTWDFSNATDLTNLFLDCRNIRVIDFSGKDTSKIKTINSFLKGCTSLRFADFTNCDFNAITDTTNKTLFSGCFHLIRLKGFVYPVSFSLSDSTLMPTENLVEVLTNLPTVSETQTITLGSTNLSKLTAEQIAIATAKGWTVA